MGKEKTENENCLAGMRCPKCRSLEPFKIECSVLMTVTDNGTDEAEGDTEWNDDDYCQCRECEFEGKVKDFYDEKDDVGKELLAAIQEADEWLESDEPGNELDEEETS